MHYRCVINKFHSMNSEEEKLFSMTRGERRRPQEFLNSHLHKRGKTFFSSQKAEPANLDIFCKTDFKANTRVLQDLIISRSTPLKKQRTSNDEFRSNLPSRTKRTFIRVDRSPYLTNPTVIQKMLRLLVPVKGPNQSLKLSIKKHNDLNLKNAELLIVKKSEGLQERMKAYSSRMGLPEDTKIFVMNSRDNHIREALLRRGWVQSGDRKSVLFHLKWTYKDQLQDYIRLQDGQFYNHFKNNQELTNKNYLKKNIKKHQEKQRPNFPISFDIEMSEDNSDFERAYGKFQVLRVLRLLGQILIKNHAAKMKKVQAGFFFSKNITRVGTVKSSSKTAKSHCNNQILYVQQVSVLKQSKELWQILSNLFSLVCLVVNEIVGLRKVSYAFFHYSKKSSRQMYAIAKQIQYALQMEEINFLDYLSPFYVTEILKIYHLAKVLICDSYGFNNMWIIKPTGVSRGSGITITSDLAKITHLKYGRIVQKYIQHPLLLACGRKFDIRQWVLVKSFSPLRAYAFKNCYGRFSSVKYSNQNYDNLQKHLTNYSQNKQVYIRQRSRLADMMTTKLISSSKNSSVLSEKQLEEQIPAWAVVKQKMMKNILKTLTCCMLEVSQREECFQVFGFDIILDENLKPYVLEVNMSPACEKRQFLDEYLIEMADGLIDSIEGKEPTNWIYLDQEEFRELQAKRYLAKRREEKARMIQQWWRSRRVG